VNFIRVLLSFDSILDSITRIIARAVLRGMPGIKKIISFIPINGGSTQINIRIAVLRVLTTSMLAFIIKGVAAALLTVIPTTRSIKTLIGTKVSEMPINIAYE
jgi:hypothetical protein